MAERTTKWAEAAIAWLERGWHPIPLTGEDSKAPARKGLTGRAGIDLERGDIAAAFQGARGLGIRMPLGVLGLDLDDYEGKQGTLSLAALCTELAVELPEAPATSGREDGSQILYYRVPEGLEWSADALAAHGGGVDLIHRGWRHAKVWPSVHHVTGLTYGRVMAGAVVPLDDEGEPWLLPYPDELPDLPGELVAALQGREGPGEREHVDWTNPKGYDDWSPAVERAWERWSGRGADRYQAMVPTQAALVRLDSLGQSGASHALDKLHEQYVAAVGDARDGESEWRRALEGAIGTVSTTVSLVESSTDLVQRLLVQPLLAKPIGTPPEVHITTNLPGEFWEARPELAHIRQAAWSRRRSPDAVLGAVLARLSAITPPLVSLPAIVGAPSTLSTFVALAGPSGTGKSSAVHLARELVPMPLTSIGDVIEHGLGSGEGLIELYMGEVETGEADAKGRPLTERRQKYLGAILTMDEGQALTAMGGRSGNTMLAHLRSMWTGAPVGQANAAKETTRKLAGGSYALGLVVGIQPALAADLLADTAAGTPQRFLWVSTADPGVPDERPAWPGPLVYRNPSRERTDLRSRPEIEVAAPIISEIDATALAAVRGLLKIDPLDSHRGLLKLKTAALLALLDRRTCVGLDDWELAELVLKTSGAVRADIGAVLSAEAERLEALAAERDAKRAAGRHSAVMSAEQEAYAVALESAARSIARRAAREGRMDRTLANRAMAGRLRKLVGTDEAIEHAVAQGWLVETGEDWKAGRVKLD